MFLNSRIKMVILALTFFIGAVFSTNAKASSSECEDLFIIDYNDMMYYCGYIEHPLRTKGERKLCLAKLKRIKSRYQFELPCYANKQMTIITITTEMLDQMIDKTQKTLPLQRTVRPLY